MRWRLMIALALAGAAGPARAQPVGDPGPTTVQPDDYEGLQVAAGVSRVQSLGHQGALDVHVFGLVGGDPAMNGEYVMLSFDGDNEQGSRIFRVADVLNFVILSDSPGRLLLSVRENVMNAGGEIGVRVRRVRVTWAVPAAGALPATVRVATDPGR